MGRGITLADGMMRVDSFVGWAKARSAVPTIKHSALMVGTLRFAHPTDAAAAQTVKESLLNQLLRAQHGLDLPKIRASRSAHAFSPA